MINGNHITALIPARGGSTSVKHKNIRSLGGKPLVAWAIDVATAVPAIDRVVVSTDDPKIAACAEEYGAEVAPRSDNLSTDDALVIDAIRYHIGEWQQREQPADILVLLEPTCPFRSAADISNCLTLLIEEDCDSVATFQKAEVNPHRIWHLQDSRPALYPGRQPVEAAPAPSSSLPAEWWGVCLFRPSTAPRGYWPSVW